ncbi:MAG: hypothetical protein IJ173_03835 [Kiritimatiellae bacterium]|nr:hypothetical protein [Kiritimatiellia bacterium]
MAGNAIDSLLNAIGYPERAPDGAVSFTLQVDGGEIVATEAGDALRLVCRLTDDAAELPRLAGYAAGRFLREAATLACDRDGAFLWQAADPQAEPDGGRRFFETFCDSCDWWRARLEANMDRGDDAPPHNEMRILP